MANPRNKWSHARTGKRRSQWKLSQPGLISCPQCHTLKVSHVVCKECGYYDGKEVIKEAEKKK